MVSLRVDYEDRHIKYHSLRYIVTVSILNDFALKISLVGVNISMVIENLEINNYYNNTKYSEEKSY